MCIKNDELCIENDEFCVFSCELEPPWAEGAEPLTSESYNWFIIYGTVRYRGLARYFRPIKLRHVLQCTQYILRANQAPACITESLGLFCDVYMLAGAGAREGRWDRRGFILLLCRLSEQDQQVILRFSIERPRIPVDKLRF